MRDRCKQGTLVWLIKFCVILAWLVIFVESSIQRVPRKMTTKSDRKRYTVKLRQYGSNEYDNFIDSLEDYAAFSEYADYADNHNIRGIQKP